MGVVYSRLRRLALPSVARYEVERAPAGAGTFRVARLLPLRAAGMAEPASSAVECGREKGLGPMLEDDEMLG